jgi:hypothetical protein
VLYGVVEQHAETFFQVAKAIEVVRYRVRARGVRGVFALWLIETRVHSYKMHGVSSRASSGVFGNCSCIALPPASMRSSCKRRGWYPSCASRRMAESGAHLVDNVLPRGSPIASGYYRSRGHYAWLFAARPQWLTRVLDVVTRALSAALLKRAGLRHCEGAHRDGDIHLTAMDGGNAKGL